MNEASTRGMAGQLAAGEGIAQADHGSAAAVSIVHVYRDTKARAVDAAEIAAGEALFAEMPLDYLPDPGNLPHVHTMPWRRNQLFTGREPDLRELARRLKQGGCAAVAQSPAITGLGGQGKTQLAVEFAYRYGRWFAGGVFFVNCADPAAMADSIAACAPALTDDGQIAGRPLPDRIALVASAWAGPLPRLLIFDNCEDESLVDAWAPRSGGCRLLITARRPAWSQARGIAVLPLGKLKREESLALLRRHRPDLAADDSGLDGIAEELGDLPLALELAGSYLGRYRDATIGRPAAYLAELRASPLLDHVSLIEDAEAPGGRRSLTGHERDVARTFAVSLNRLRPEETTDALARRLLAHAAWLAPGLPIPRALLRLCAGLTEDDAATERRFTDALDRLLVLALVERAGETGAVVLHRLVAAFARTQVDAADETRRASESALAEIADYFLSQGDPTPLRGWAGHLLAAAIAAERDGTDAAVRLLNAAGYYNQMIADIEASTRLLNQAVVLAEAIYGPNRPEVATTLGNLGNVQQQRGDLTAAEASQTRALAIVEAAYGPDHPEVARTLTHLGNVQRQRGDLAAAEANQTRALAIVEAAHGPDHPEVARTLTNLGIVQQQRGDLAAAEASQTRALAIKEAAYGLDHPEVATTLGNLGNLQQERGDWVAAEARQTRALAIEEAAYGPNHPEVAKTLGNLGNVQQQRGDLAAAEASQTRALAIVEAAYGPDHPEVARTLTNLGIVQQQRGDLAAAEASQTRALAIEEAAYGPDHSEVARTLSNLGNLQQERGDWVAAEASQTRALAIEEAAYGPDHPEVAKTLGNLGNVQRASNRPAAARESYRRASEIFATRLGEQHPHAVQARRLLAELDGSTQEKGSWWKRLLRL